MSLINQMLKDLETRKGGDGQSRPETLSRRSGSMLPWVIAGILAVIVVALAIKVSITPAALPAEPLPVASKPQLAQPDTSQEHPATETDREPAVGNATALREAASTTVAGAQGSETSGTQDETPTVAVKEAMPEPQAPTNRPEPTRDSSTSNPAEPTAQSRPEKMTAEQTEKPKTQTAEPRTESAEPRNEEGSMTIAPASLSPPEQARANIQRGFAAMQRRDYPRAIDEFTAGLAILPKEDDARLALYQALRRQGRVAEAIGVLEDGMADAEQPHRFAELLARHYASRGQVPMAISLLAVAPPRVAQDPEYYALWGALLQQQGDYEAALPIYEELVAHDPRKGQWLAGLGVAQQQTGDSTAALDSYRAALDAGGLPSTVEDYVKSQVDALDPEEN